MFKIVKTLLVVCIAPFSVTAQLPFKTAKEIREPETVTRYFSAEKVLWQNSTKTDEIKNLGRILNSGNGQADLANKDMCILRSTETFRPAFLLDFGKEIHGGIQLVTGMYSGNKPVKLRIRFGESVTEAMSDIEPNQNATNDHAMRDMIVEVPWLGVFEVGNTGFRFVRIDVVEADINFQLKEVNAAFVFRDIPYLGSFNSSDSLLNEIWKTGAYTVHLNMQDYLWDGIKRDRLVWVGDMHPEVSTIMAVFGNNNVVSKSLDLSRDITPIPQWMNGISTYSMWWVIIHRDWYYHNGDLEYLKQQREYLLQLLPHLLSKIGKDNKETLDGNRFLDWPSSENKKGVDAGLQAMMVWALNAGAEICDIIGERSMAKECREGVSRLKKYVPEPNQSKQAAALMSIADLWPAQKANTEVIAKDGVKDFSTFYGYYMLQSMAKAGDYQGAIDAIRTYWGAMLNLGATTFWEDFNMDWVKDAARIDELPVNEKKDIHGNYGAYCYVGFRHSLCHGWASGPTPWLTEHVLGISVVEPGGKTIRVVPNLGDLQFAEGTFPTPSGVVKVRHEKQANGEVKTEIQAPAGIKIVRE